MVLTDEKHIAFRKWFESTGLSFREAGNKHGVSHATIRTWYQCHPPINIKLHYWEKFETELAPYLGMSLSSDDEFSELRLILEKCKKTDFKLFHHCVKTLKTVANGFLATQNTAKQSKEMQLLASEVVQKRALETEFELVPGNTSPHGYYESVAAGSGSLVHETHTMLTVKGLEHRKDINIFEVSGESMSPLYKAAHILVVQRFNPPIHLGEEFIEADIARAMAPEGSQCLIELNEEGLMVKTLNYRPRKGGPGWILQLHAENEEWSIENAFPRAVRMEDDLIIYAKVLGKGVVED